MSLKSSPQSGPQINNAENTLFRILTPEGVPLSLQIAFAGDRMLAFMIDFLIIVICVVVVWALAALSGAAEALAVALMVSFVLRNFYFMFFEQRWQGATPGKRNRKLRVVDVNGGQLSVEAIIVRNLTRDIEIFIPLAVLTTPQLIWPAAPAMAAPFAGLWVVILGLMPLFNKHRRRVGDLIAGTMVIAAPQVELLRDLAVKNNTPSVPGDPLGFAFTKAHLSYYGIYELQVLEDVLRKTGFDSSEEKMKVIRRKVVAKIGWEKEVYQDHGFLKAFYAAQRAHLEGRMLMGDRREDKFGGVDPATRNDD